MAAGPLLEKAAHLLFDHSLFNGHPRFFGYITSSPAPIGMLGDLLAAAVNANAGAWRLAPMASEIEGQAVRWIAELLGYRPGCGGLFVSGGNMANIVGFYAARAAAGEAWRIRSAGVGAADARTAARVRLGGNAHVGPEGRRSVRPRHRRDSLDRHRRRHFDSTRRCCARRWPLTSPPAISR